MKRLVADTGPILHLHEAGALHLLPLIGEIFLPPPVWSPAFSAARPAKAGTPNFTKPAPAPPHSFVAADVRRLKLLRLE